MLVWCPVSQRDQNHTLNYENHALGIIPWKSYLHYGTYTYTLIIPLSLQGGIWVYPSPYILSDFENNSETFSLRSLMLSHQLNFARLYHSTVWVAFICILFIDFALQGPSPPVEIRRRKRMVEWWWGFYIYLCGSHGLLMILWQCGVGLSEETGTSRVVGRLRHRVQDLCELHVLHEHQQMLRVKNVWVAVARVIVGAGRVSRVKCRCPHHCSMSSIPTCL